MASDSVSGDSVFSTDSDNSLDVLLKAAVLIDKTKDTTCNEIPSVSSLPPSVGQNCQQPSLNEVSFQEEQEGKEDTIIKRKRKVTKEEEEEEESKETQITTEPLIITDQPNVKHNENERKRRRQLKLSVHSLRDQLKRKTRRPAVNSVLKAAFDEIQELTKIEEEQCRLLEELKQKNIILTCYLDRQLKDISDQKKRAVDIPHGAHSQTTTPPTQTSFSCHNNMPSTSTPLATDDISSNTLHSPTTTNISTDSSNKPPSLMPHPLTLNSPHPLTPHPLMLNRPHHTLIHPLVSPLLSPSATYCIPSQTNTTSFINNNSHNTCFPFYLYSPTTTTIPQSPAAILYRPTLYVPTNYDYSKLPYPAQVPCHAPFSPSYFTSMSLGGGGFNVGQNVSNWQNEITTKNRHSFSSEEDSDINKNDNHKTPPASPPPLILTKKVKKKKFLSTSTEIENSNDETTIVNNKKQKLLNGNSVIKHSSHQIHVNSSDMYTETTPICNVTTPLAVNGYHVTPKKVSFKIVS